MRLRRSPRKFEEVDGVWSLTVTWRGAAPQMEAINYIANARWGVPPAVGSRPSELPSR